MAQNLWTFRYLWRTKPQNSEDERQLKPAFLAGRDGEEKTQNSPGICGTESEFVLRICAQEHEGRSSTRKAGEARLGAPIRAASSHRSWRNNFGLRSGHKGHQQIYHLQKLHRAVVSLTDDHLRAALRSSRRHASERGGERVLHPAYEHEQRGGSCYGVNFLEWW